MKVHEYQAKELLATVRRAGAARARRGDGGRGGGDREGAGRAGGGEGADPRRRARQGRRHQARGLAEQAREVASQIIGMNLVTHQTGPEGRLVKRVLVEEQLQVERELYLGVVIDNSIGLPLVMASADGGVDIEEVAAKTPERIHKIAGRPDGRLPAVPGARAGDRDRARRRDDAAGRGADRGALPCLRRERLHAGGGQPARRHEGRAVAGGGREAELRRQRAVPAQGAGGAAGHRRGGPAGGRRRRSRASGTT